MLCLKSVHEPWAEENRVKIVIANEIECTLKLRPSEWRLRMWMIDWWVNFAQIQFSRLGYFYALIICVVILLTLSRVHLILLQSFFLEIESIHVADKFIILEALIMPLGPTLHFFVFIHPSIYLSFCFWSINILIIFSVSFTFSYCSYLGSFNFNHCTSSYSPHNVDMSIV